MLGLELMLGHEQKHGLGSMRKKTWARPWVRARAWAKECVCVSAWIRARVWARVCKWFRTRELGHGLGLGH